MKIALGVSGGIAAYKAAELVRLLQDRDLRVQVVMTRAAQEFVRPLTFAALSGEKVITDLFGSKDQQANLDSAVEHIAVAQAIDALLVVPATADVIARFAQGIANDFLTTLYLATTAPVVIAPAMNVNMWNHEATQTTMRPSSLPFSTCSACRRIWPGRPSSSPPGPPAKRSIPSATLPTGPADAWAMPSQKLLSAAAPACCWSVDLLQFNRL